MIIYDSSKEDGTYYNQFRILQHCTVCLPSRCPSPPIAVVFSVHRRCARAVPCRRGAIVCHPLPSRSRRTVHCRQGAVAPYLTIIEPLAMSTDDSDHSSCPSNPLVIRLVVALPLLTPPPICRHLSLQPLPFLPLIHPASCPISLLLTSPPPICQCLCLSSHRRLLLSCPSRASHLAGLGIASPHAATTYLRDNLKQSTGQFNVSLMD